MFFGDSNNNITDDLLRQNGLIFFKLCKQTDTLSVNANLKDFFPNSIYSHFTTGRSVLKNVHKNDRHKVLSYLYRDSEYLTNDLDFRVSLSPHEENWLRLTVQPINDGKELMGTVQNVTVDKSIFLNIAYTAYTDDLTGLLNKERLKQKIALALNGHVQHGIKSILLIISIDNISSINKSFGHNVTDNIIQSVAERLVNTRRETDIIARISSGKFAILLTDIHENVGYEDVELIGRRFLNAIQRNNFSTNSGAIYITASGSGCLVPQDANTVDALLINTDEALSHAKKRGHNSFVIFKKEFIQHEERKENIMLSTKIVDAIETGRICTAFQPVLNKDNPDKSFFELLARIKESDNSLLPAYKFIPIAESTGFIRMIDMEVIKSALYYLNQYNCLNLSVNISGYTLLNYSFTNHILNMIAQYRHVLPRLVIEITETVALQDIYAIDTFLENLKKSGCKVALDDFGAGYNSFANLRAFQFDIVKIDGSYVRDIHKDHQSQVFVESLSTMSKKLNIEVVAEMVGGDEDLAILGQYPVDYFQGFMFGKPTLDIAEALSDSQKSFQHYWNKQHYFEDYLNKKHAS